ncbi:MAG: hypothetical protein JSV08_01750 [Acidobacteriota bacterium]|nr:MAG: hypothetical protein JSV08_01750 [Acidobacteriota bacterium]
MKKLLVLCGFLAIAALVFAPAAKEDPCSPDAPCLAKNALYIKKSFKNNDDGSLACAVTGEVYARPKKDGDKVVYTAGDGEKTYSNKYDAAAVVWEKNYPGDNPFDKICFDENGSIICPCCNAVVVEAKKDGDEVTYVAGNRKYDCPYEALFGAAPECQKRCKNSSGSAAPTSTTSSTSTD